MKPFRLSELGWDDEMARGFEPFLARGLEPARVIRQLRDLSLLASERGELSGEVSGKFRHEALDRSAFPVVGDWVAMEPYAGDAAVIHAVLPRRGAFVRKAAGEAVEAQVVAANVDTVFLVSGLDGDLSLRRIERYLAAAWESGAAPVILLNKADLRPDLEDVLGEVALVARGAPVVALSALEGGGIDALRPYLAPRRTVALLGSSGVGKSTLINRLLGEERFRTADVSDAEAGRGRHTTTTRELVVLPGGALLIDTPGMRELQPWTGDDGLDRPFSDIESLAALCRFLDCSHEREPGCAVRAAIEAGTLDARRLESYHKLRKELRVQALKKDARSRRQAEKASGRRFATLLKEVKKNKPRYQ